MESPDERGYYYNENLEAFGRGYEAVHGYLAFTVCLFGIASNIANMVVFTRRNMISPTHAILTALAATDMLLMLLYAIFTFHAHIRGERQNPAPTSYERAVFDLVSSNVRAVAWTVSNWTTVAVAIFRAIAVRCPDREATWCSMSRAKCAIVATCLCSAVYCIPIYIMYRVVPIDEEGLYRFDYSLLVKRNGFLLLRFISWYQIVRWLNPCVALTVVSCLLIGYRLLQRKALPNTTRMLLAVFLLTLIAQLPLVLMRLCTFILGTDFGDHVTKPLSSLFEAVILINTGFKFTIYISMSCQFRNRFVTLIPWMAIWTPRCEPISESAATMADTVI